LGDADLPGIAIMHFKEVHDSPIFPSGTPKQNREHSLKDNISFFYIAVEQNIYKIFILIIQCINRKISHSDFFKQPYHLYFSHISMRIKEKQTASIQGINKMIGQL